MEIGLTYTTTMRVVAETTADYIGSGDLAVLATPAMCALMEGAAMMAVAPHLEAGQTTVGTTLNIEHLRATPVGGVVSATACLVKEEGRALHFEVEACDEKGVVGKGSHTRFVVDRERFMSKLK